MIVVNFAICLKLKRFVEKRPDPFASSYNRPEIISGFAKRKMDFQSVFFSDGLEVHPTASLL